MPNSKNTPIKEIVLSISFKEELGLDCFEKFKSKELIQNTFSDIRPGFNANLTSNSPDKPPKTDITYIFKSDPSLGKILLAKRGSFSFHKIKEYEPYENLIKELNEYWSLFEECSQKLTVSLVSLRYINFIKLDEGEVLNDCVTVTTNHPFAEILNNFNQIRFNIDNKSNTDGTVVVTNGIDNNNNGVLLDISISRKFNSKNFKKIEEAFEGMRNYKNDIFNKSITNQTKKKYE